MSTAHFFRLVRLTLCTLILVPAAAGQAAVTAVTRDMTKARVSAYVLHGRYPLEQFFRLGVVDGALAAEVAPEFLEKGTQVRVEVEGSNATWVVRRGPAVAGDGPYAIVSRYDFDAPPDAIWQTTITVKSKYLAISGAIGDTADGVQVRLLQSNGTLNLTCTNVQRGARNTFFLATASSLRQLQGEHPEEVRRYLTPILRNLSGRLLLRPGATDVYRAFDAIRPDPQAARKLDDLLLKLEADAYAVREQASKDLAALGPAGVLAALRRDNADLSGEAKNRLDRFIAEQSSMSADDVAAARRDRSFLLDCMDDDDAAVRAAAKAALDHVIGKPVEFDLTLTGAARAKAVEALRRNLEPGTRPGTRPATRPAE